MEDYIFAMLTVNREELGGEEQLTRTMQSLRNSGFWEQAGHCRFIMCDGGSKDTAYLYPFGELAEVHVFECAGGQRITHVDAYCRVLEYSTRYRARYLVVLEDDVLFCRNWFLNLVRWLDKVSDPDVWVYSLYTPYEHVRVAYNGGVDTWLYPTGAFYGTQALVFLHQNVPVLAAHIRDDLRPGHGDRNLQLALAAKGQEHLLACCPSLVQHQDIGGILHTPHHQAQSFLGESVDPGIATKSDK